MKKLLVPGLMAAIFCLFTLNSCTVIVPSTLYAPQNIVRIKGQAAMGAFQYLPYREGTIKDPKEIRSSSPMTIALNSDVASLVQKATMLELEASGVIINSSAPYTVSGDILDVYAEDMGGTIDVFYKITYKIADKSGAVVFEQTYSPGPAISDKNIWSNPILDYNTPISEAICAAYSLFARNPEVQKLLKK
jgi:hypothetical protein